MAHHPRKNDETYRGPDAIEDDFDTIMHVIKTDAERLEDRLLEVEMLKVKDALTTGHGPTEPPSCMSERLREARKTTPRSCATSTTQSTWRPRRKRLHCPLSSSVRD